MRSARSSRPVSVGGTQRGSGSDDGCAPFYDIGEQLFSPVQSFAVEHLMSRSTRGDGSAILHSDGGIEQVLFNRIFNQLLVEFIDCSANAIWKMVRVRRAGV